MIRYAKHTPRAPQGTRPTRLSGRPAQRLTLALCALWHAALFLWLFKFTPLYYVIGSDTQHVYWPATRTLLAGHVPYLDPHFVLEYPPLGTAIFVLPALLHPSSLRAFDWLFSAEMLLADLALLVCLAALARRLRLSVAGTVLGYSLVMPLLGAVVCQRYDLVPAALVLAAFYALLAGRSTWAWTLLWLATLAKLYPAVLAPLFLLYEWRRGRRAGALLYAAGLAAFVISWQALAPASLRYFLAWETRRGLEIESLFGALSLVLHLLGLPVHIVPPSVYGSYDASSALAPALETLSTLLTAVTVGALYVGYARRVHVPTRAVVAPAPHTRAHAIPATTNAAPSYQDAKQEPRRAERFPGVTAEIQPSKQEARQLVVYAALAVLALLLCAKLLSIQYLLWVLPLLVLQPRARRSIIILCLLLCALSQWLFPFHWNALWSFQPLAVLLMAARDGLLLALFVLLWRGVDTEPP